MSNKSHLLLCPLEKEPGSLRDKAYSEASWEYLKKKVIMTLGWHYIYCVDDTQYSLVQSIIKISRL